MTVKDRTAGAWSISNSSLSRQLPRPRVFWGGKMTGEGALKAEYTLRTFIPSNPSPLTPNLVDRRPLRHPLTRTYHVRWCSSASHSAPLNTDIDALLGSCMRLNNAAQRIFGDFARPVIRVQETNDCENRWFAEARCECH